MSHFKLRVDLTSEAIPQKLFDLMDKYFVSHAWCLEDGKDNPHFHVYGLSTEYKAPAIRQSLRKFVARKGDYSLASLNYNAEQWKENWPLHYLAYMHKEGPVSATNIPDTILEEAELLSKTIGEAKTKRQSQTELVYAAMDQFFKGKDIDWRTEVYAINSLYSYLIGFLQKEGLPIRRNMISYWIDNYCVRFPSYSAMLVRCLAERHFPLARVT